MEPVMEYVVRADRFRTFRSGDQSHVGAAQTDYTIRGSMLRLSLTASWRVYISCSAVSTIFESKQEFSYALPVHGTSSNRPCGVIRNPNST